METERPLQVPPTCPGWTFTPSDHRSLGSPGHFSCPHAVEITRTSHARCLHSGGTCDAHSFVHYPALWLTCSLPGTHSLEPAVHGSLCPLPNRPMAISWRSCLEASVSAYCQWKGTKDNHGWVGWFLHEDVGTRAGNWLHGWYEWAVDMRLTLPVKCSTGSTAYGDSEQGAAQ